MHIAVAVVVPPLRADGSSVLHNSQLWASRELACIDEHTRLAPDFAFPDAFLLCLVDPLLACNERIEVVPRVSGQSHSIRDYSSEDSAELLDVFPD